MMLKPLRIVFLALGLAMVALGFFYRFAQKEQVAHAEEIKPRVPVEGFETYTLENDRYEGEYSPQTEFTFLNETDSSAVLLLEEEPAVNTVNAAGFTKEFEMLEEEQSLSVFPTVLIISGAVFLCFGVMAFRKSTVSDL